MFQFMKTMIDKKNPSLPTNVISNFINHFRSKQDPTIKVVFYLDIHFNYSQDEHSIFN